jgi:DNA-binding HxlR family transcriptional regulator
MLVYNKRYYREFVNSSEGIATNVLADRLKTLVEDGLATRDEDPQNRGQAAYFPTKKALALAPILNGMVAWGLTYGPDNLKKPKGIKEPSPRSRPRNARRRRNESLGPVRGGGEI